MTAPLSPESARSWFTTFYSITEKSTPITMFFILVFTVMGYMVTKNEIHRLHGVNMALWQSLETKHNEIVKLALDCQKEQSKP